MFWYIPIERLDERYTAQMFNWVTSSLNNRNIAYRVIEGHADIPTTTEGKQFLNWTGTIDYKASQIRQIASAFSAGDVKDGDIFFVADIWFPGIESIAYMSQMLGIKTHIYAIQHAGVFMPFDLVTDLVSWGQYQEAAWYTMCSAVFVGSEHIKNHILDGLKRAHIECNPNIVATGMPYDGKDVFEFADADSVVPQSKKIVIWPHRISPDKNIDDFVKIARALHGKYPDVRWVVSSSRISQQYTPQSPVEFVAQSKKSYYQMMRSALLTLSTAYLETYGYTIRESTTLGTPILCPTRCNYPEMVLTPDNLYDSIDEAISKTERAINYDLPIAQLKELRGFEAMLDIMLKK